MRVLISLICFMTFISGCSSKSSPEKVMDEYLNAYLHGDFQTAYNYLSSSDKKVKSLKEFSSATNTKQSAFKKVLYDNITFEIKDIDVDEGNAKAEILVTTPDLEVMFRDLYTAAFGAIHQDVMDEEAIDKMLADRYSRGGLPMTTNLHYFDMVKEPDGWKIYLGLKVEKRDIDTIEQFMGKDYLQKMIDEK